MLEEKEVKRILGIMKAIGKPNHTVGSVVSVAQAVSKLIEKRHRYACGIERLEVNEENGKAYGFFLSPDGQNGEFYYALKDVGFQHHFRVAEYYWGVRIGKIILTYTEGDLAVFVEPEGYQPPKH